MTLRCCRPPRSAGRNAVRPTLTVSPTARFSWSARSAIEAAARIAASTVDSSPRPVCTLRWRSRMIHASAVCSRSNSLTWISPWRAVRLPVDPVHGIARRVRPDGRRQGRRLERAHRRGMAALERRRGQVPAGQRLEPRVDDDRDPLPDRRRRLEEAERVAGPDVQRLDPEVAATRQRGADEPRPLGPPAQGDRPARQPARQGRRVVDLQPRLRHPAAVAERVGHPHPVADMAVELADRVARLEVGQPEPDQDVRAADDQDRQVEQVEQERLAGRERAEDEHEGDDQQLELADHGSVTPSRDGRSGARRRG